eukprot:4819890-Pyramimonas_sp.AAC.1
MSCHGNVPRVSTSMMSRTSCFLALGGSHLNARAPNCSTPFALLSDMVPMARPIDSTAMGAQSSS